MRWRKFGERLRQAMYELGVTQKQLADILGVKPPTVNQWLQGKSYPSSDRLAEICQYLDLSADDLLFGSKNSSQEKHPWLVSLEEMHSLESNAQNNIWIITKSLENDIPGGKFSKLVRINAERGINYTYIVPSDDETIRYNKDELKFKTFKNFESACQVVEIPDFNKVILYNHAMFFDPYNGDTLTSVYHQLPLHKGNYWWIRLEDDFARKFIGQVKLLMDRID